MFVAQDFTNLDYAEEMSHAALNTLTAPGDLVDRALVMNDRATSGIAMPWSQLSGVYTMRPGELVLLAGGSAGGLAVYLHADYIRDTWFSAAMMRSEVSLIVDC